MYQTAIQDPTVLAALSAALQAIPQKLVTFTIPGATGTFNVSIGPISVSLPFSRILAVPLDGNVLNIAADVSPYTTGDPALMNLITVPQSSRSTSNSTNSAMRRRGRTASWSRTVFPSPPR